MGKIGQIKAYAGGRASQRKNKLVALRMLLGAKAFLVITDYRAVASVPAQINDVFYEMAEDIVAQARATDYEGK